MYGISISYLHLFSHLINTYLIYKSNFLSLKWLVLRMHNLITTFCCDQNARLESALPAGRARMLHGIAPPAQHPHLGWYRGCKAHVVLLRQKNLVMEACTLDTSHFMSRLLYFSDALRLPYLPVVRALIGV